ncbi:MAG: SAM-dependent methyltransferase [Desulfurococcaceae archaeon TW002]
MDNWEEFLSPWLLSEYSFVADLFKSSLVFTNVTNERMLQVLNTLAKATPKNVREFLVVSGIPVSKVIILDPVAYEELSPEDLEEAEAVVIGGIMGDHPPKRRTHELITSKLPGAVARNLGKEQLTIAGAAYVLKKISEGLTLRDLDIRFGLTIKLNILNSNLEIFLPYAFPYEKGEPVLPKEYLKVISMRSLFYEGVELSQT